MKKAIGVLAAVVLIFMPLRVGALSTSARAAALINGHTGELIYAHNADMRLPMASTTKIMTALLLCETGVLGREIVTTKEMVTVEGSSMGLLPGDTVSYHDLLYGLLLASGNDAANTVAIAVGGSVKGFTEMMNQKAADLGLINTHFVTPSGLDAVEHYTTAKELALLARHAMQNEDFAAAAGSKSARLCYGNPPYNRTLTNHNKLLNRFSGTVGVKTGFTKKSGRCLVSAAVRDEEYVIAVTLNDGNDWNDHEKMLEYGFSALTASVFLPQKSTYALPVAGGDSEFLNINIAPYTIGALEKEKISCVINMPQLVYPPVRSGDIVGSVEYYCDGQLFETLPVTAGTDIIKKTYKRKLKEKLLQNIYIILGELNEGH